MKITTYTDFGIRVLMYLATLPVDERTSTAAIADIYQASRNHMAKVIAQLSALGYIASSRGKYGGIRLSKPAANINIGQLVRELEVNLTGVDCGASQCNLVTCCELKKILQTGMNAFLLTLDQYHLSDLINNQDLRQILLPPTSVANAADDVES